MSATCTAPVTASAPVTAHIVTRSQPSHCGRSGYRGPDHYVAVVLVPEGQQFDPARTPVNVQALKRRGIRVLYCGEYYGQHQGPRSAYGAAMAEARRIAHDATAR